MSVTINCSFSTNNFGYPEGKHGGNTPKKIVIHHWDSVKKKPTFNGTVNTIRNGSVSAHLVAEASHATMLVRFSDPAWHAGDKYMNMHSIGIECNPRASYEDMQTVAELIAMIWGIYGKLPVIGHKDVVATGCPGLWYSKIPRLVHMAEVIYYNCDDIGDYIEPDGIWGKDTSLKTQVVLGVKWRDGVISGQYERNIGKCIRENAIANTGWEWIPLLGDGSDTVEAIQALVGCKVDGLLGPDSFRAMQKFLHIPVTGILDRDTVREWQRYLNRRGAK